MIPGRGELRLSWRLALKLFDRLAAGLWPTRRSRLSAEFSGEMISSQRKAIGGRWALPFLGVACAVGVASIYYNQPLLLVMGKDFGESDHAMGFVAVATHVGYAAG